MHNGDGQSTEIDTQRSRTNKIDSIARHSSSTASTMRTSRVYLNVAGGIKFMFLLLVFYSYEYNNRHTAANYIGRLLRIASTHPRIVILVVALFISSHDTIFLLNYFNN